MGALKYIIQEFLYILPPLYDVLNELAKFKKGLETVAVVYQMYVKFVDLGNVVVDFELRF